MAQSHPSSSGNDKAPFPWLASYPADIDWNAPLSQKSLVEMFDDSVRKYGNRTCLSFMGKKYSYKDVGDMVDKMARGLQNQGVDKGSKVGICLPNTPFYVVSFFGALKAGATVVNFNPLYAEKEIKNQIEDSECELMIGLNVKQIYPKLEKMLTQTSCLKKIIACDLADALPLHKKILYMGINGVQWALGKNSAVKIKTSHNIIPMKKLLANNGQPRKIKIDPAQDIAVLQYTGGTTGTPKGAMLTHKNLVSNTEQVSLWFNDRVDGKEKMLAVLPFFHVFAMTGQMNFSVRNGIELAMLPRFDLNETLKTIHKEKPTLFFGVPTIYKAIADHPKLSTFDLSSLKTCISGGAALPEKIKNLFEKNVGIPLCEGYGLSECSPVAAVSPIAGAVRKTNSIGLPMPGTEIKIIDPEFPDRDVPVNVTGEICLRGPQVMKGYWKNQAETDKVIDKQGFLHTGDVGYMDEQGYTFIVNRIKDIIIASGYNVYPKKVEEAILEHPAVSEVIVGGIKDDYRGETVKAWIVLKPDQKLTAGELKEFLKDRISPIETPKKIDFRDSLPKTMIGKPDKKVLIAEEYAKAAARPNAGGDTTNAPPPPNAAQSRRHASKTRVRATALKLGDKIKDRKPVAAKKPALQKRRRPGL